MGTCTPENKFVAYVCFNSIFLVVTHVITTKYYKFTAHGVVAQ